MSSSDNSVGSITLDQLLALNDEIAALVRAGIPLDRGLTELGRDAPGKLGIIASRLADRMHSGETLAEILARDETDFPPVWRAVVLAGIRSGHLAAALEGLSRTGRRALELRRSIALSMIYPMMVLLIAYGVFLFTIVFLAPPLLSLYESFEIDVFPFGRHFVHLGQTVEQWAIFPPIIVIVLCAYWWYRTGRVVKRPTRSESGIPRSFVFRRHRPNRIPSIRQSLRDGRMATFAELLRLMNEHEVPIHEAVVLAADASGDGGLSQAARRIAGRLEGGERIRGRDDLPAQIPPLLGWSLVSGMKKSSLSRTLGTSAEMYRQRAVNAARWAVVYLPILFTVVIGGSAVLVQALIVFLPFVQFLRSMG